MAQQKRRRSPKVINPYTEEALPSEQAKEVNRLRRARTGARRAARSGHPGKAAEARRVLGLLPQAINQLYVNDARGK